MSNNQNTDSGSTEISNQVPQVVYAYPPLGARSGEVDIGEMLSKLFAQSGRMFLIVFFGVLLSIIVALIIPKEFKQVVEISQPVSADFAALNANGTDQFTSKTIFKRYYNELRSPEKLDSYIKENNYLEKLYPESNDNENGLVAEFRESFSIHVLEPKPSDDAEGVFYPERVSISAIHERESVIAELLNGYVNAVQSQLLTALSAEQKWEIKNKLNLIDKEITLLRSKAKREREFQIARIEAENSKQLKDFRDRINALTSKAEVEKQHEILAVREAYDMAEKLKIKKPTYLSEFNRGTSEMAGTTEINLTNSQELPLYLMGTNYLDARIVELTERANNVPFISGYTELIEKIYLIENDPVLASLKNRKSDDPYIPELTGLLATQEELKSKSLNFDSVKLFRLEKKAEITEKAVKPNIALIIILGLMISVFIAIFTGLILAAISKNKGIST